MENIKRSKIIADKYVLENNISNGTFGAVFKGKTIDSSEPVAIKFENPGMKSLKYETKILNYLYSNKVRIIPAIYWYGLHNTLPCLIMTYYEYSLKTYFERNTIEKLDKIMAKLITILSIIHKEFIIHRDIKPENFMIKDGEIHIIDFGLATFFIDEQGKHLQNEENKTIIGSPRWISIHIFEGNRYSRRDDLISLGYIYLKYYLGNTPWEPDNIELNSIETGENKLNINHPINILRKEKRKLDMFKKILPIDSKIMKYLEIVYMYEYTDKPDYNKLIEIFL